MAVPKKYIFAIVATYLLTLRHSSPPYHRIFLAFFALFLSHVAKATLLHHKT